MVSLSLASGLSDYPGWLPSGCAGVFSWSHPAHLGFIGELNSLLELLSLCCEEPTSLLEVVDSIGILSLVLPLGCQGGGMLVGRGRSSAAQRLVSPRFLVEQVYVLVSGGRLHVPPCSMAWLGGPLGFVLGGVNGALLRVLSVALWSVPVGAFSDLFSPPTSWSWVSSTDFSSSLINLEEVSIVDMTVRMFISRVTA